MSLVSSKDFAALLKLDKIPVVGFLVGKFLLFITQLNKANRVYDTYKHKPILPYLNGLLNEYEIRFHVSQSDLDKIPKEGAFITISNHPLGGIDGVLLLKNILERRDDYKVIANFLLQKQAPVAPYILPVNPFDDRKDDQSSVKGLITSLKHLKEGKPLGIFPAGEVSTLKERNIYVDKTWEEGAVKLIKKANVPVIPVYFHAKNSRLFYFLSKINPVLRTLKLPSELNNKKRQVIHIKIGDPIKEKEIQKIDDLNVLNNFLREKTYLLSKSFLRKKKLVKQYRKRLKKRVKQVALPKNQKDICKEINTIREQKKRLFVSNEYEVFFTKANHIPNLMEEIGRLREITFRLIGEGTNKKCDTDKYDDYYHHLILWNKEEEKFVGAYRMGLGQEIFKSGGFKSFYVANFFNFSSEMNEKLPETIEMGRAFIVPEFQQKPMPLFLLWRGIAAVTVKYPQYKYLMGGATISNLFTEYSKSMLMYFLDKYYSNAEVKHFITSKNPFEVDLTASEKLYVENNINGDVKKLDKLIKEVEGDKLRLPVLIKQYIKQNAKFVAYNIDQDFNDAIDALIFMKINDIPRDTIEPILKDVVIEN
ncbi:putative hemolysin [Wenyingzhuangia heitensis]|uniref:Hemolysin n=1 Tax=Wenyingzhuangia heitensis TaxID=1487859 RepID=A0ABX0U468_9FLAO|nr:lysophospholipid acyltransferase family protein [Wenyingzhuangia heitensis]NIJ43665.1 putative hemolysin [Wenyingzhuangia heitensis]